MSSLSGGIAVATVEHRAPSTAPTTEVLYRRHAERIWRYCLHFLRRPADAEDAVQQTFLQAHRALARGVEPESEVAWLLTIARNVCLTRADTQRRRGSAEIGEDSRLLDLAADDTSVDGVSEDVRDAFARLPERQRRALFMREWQECSYAEIAQALGTSESAVETLLVRARRTLARELAATRRRARDLAGLLGWLRTAVGSTGAKVVVGAAVVGAAAAGSAVTVTQPHSHPHPAARPVAARHAHVVVQPMRHAVVQVRRAVAKAPAVVPVRHTRIAKRSVVPPPAVPPVAMPAVPGSPSSPAATAQAPAKTPAQAAAPPASAPTVPTAPAPAPTTTTVANVVTTATSTATGAVSSTVNTVAQTVSNAVPAAAPVVTTVAQTVDQTVNQTAQTVDDTTKSVVTTVSNLLPGG